MKEIERKDKPNQSKNTGVTLKFEIKPWDDVSDEEEVLQDCKDVEIDGVIWDKGEMIPVSATKSKILLGCTLANSDIDVEAVKKELENLECVEGVKFIP